MTRVSGMTHLLMLWLFVGSCFASGCEQKPASPNLETPAAKLTLLGSSSVHLYVQKAFESLPRDVSTAVAARHRELVRAGMTCSRHLFDWSDLQPQPDQINTQFVIDAMDARIQQGTPRQFVNITVVDSFGPEAIPDFVAKLLQQGVAWDDPRIVEPFEKMLSVLVPLMLERGMYMISFANEPGGYYENEPKAAAGFTRFIRQAIQHTRTLSDQLSITIVFAGHEDVSIPHLMPLVDVATFNQYAYTITPEPACTHLGVALPFFRAIGPEGVASLLDQMIAVAGGRLICIQEFGQATGWNDAPQTLGPLAGLDTQRQVIEALIHALHERKKHFRTVCLWTLNDHTPAGMQYVADAIVQEGLPRCYAANIAEIFGPTGLVRSDATASPKPAFAVFKSALSTESDPTADKP